MSKLDPILHSGIGVRGNAVSPPTVKKLIRAVDLLKKERSWAAVAKEMDVTEDILHAARNKDYINMRHLQKFRRWVDTNMRAVRG